MDLRHAADELYALKPGEFTAARDGMATAVRGDGDRQLADEIKSLRRPSRAAWVLNMVARRQPDEIESLLRLGGALRNAQEQLEGNQLRRLGVQRRELVSALAALAGRLAAEEGQQMSESVLREVKDTIEAALIDPDSAAELRAGHLVKAIEPGDLGFGTEAIETGPADVAKRPLLSAQTRAAENEARSRLSEADGLVLAAEKRRAEAQKHVQQLTEALEEARSELKAATDDAERAIARRDAAKGELERREGTPTIGADERRVR